MILDHIEDPHNFGAIIRSAAAFGVDALFVHNHNQAGITPLVARTSVGGVFACPIIPVKNIAELITQFKKHKIWVYGLSGSGKTAINTVDFLDDTALVVGNEGSGLRTLTETLCDDLVSIPQSGNMESLNASVAVGVALYQAYIAKL